MQLLCSLITLMFMNGSYVFVSFNMDSVIELSSESETEETDTVSDPSRDFNVSDILDLEIFNFDVEELANSNEQSQNLNTMIQSRQLVGKLV
jgi:hypothetical protein